MVRLFIKIIAHGGAVFATFELQTLPTAAPVEHNKYTLRMSQSECSASLDAYFELSKRAGLGYREETFCLSVVTFAVYSLNKKKYIGARKLTMRRR